MKIVSWNVNGLRSVYKKTFPTWLFESNAEIVCLQEIKLVLNQIPEDLFLSQTYQSYFNFAEIKGYSGVAIFSKSVPLATETKIGFKRFDQEGRMLRLDYEDFILICLYLPHGGRTKENLAYKLEVYSHLIEYLRPLSTKRIIFLGDFNIAHTEIDLARPRANKNNTMFTKEERAKIQELLDLGFVDSFREFCNDAGQYTWWPYMANARQRGIGWRIDYIFISQSLIPNLKNAFISSETLGSDHCPIGIEL